MQNQCSQSPGRVIVVLPCLIPPASGPPVSIPQYPSCLLMVVAAEVSTVKCVWLLDVYSITPHEVDT